MASVIVAGARTPFGKFGGAFKDVPATSLGAHAIRAALDRAGVGGAVALGHPIGASGARLVLTVAYELKRRGLRTGAAALCGGGGQGDATIVTRPRE
jgi:acetyl-CoA acetyltransferase